MSFRSLRSSSLLSSFSPAFSHLVNSWINYTFIFMQRNKPPKDRHAPHRGGGEQPSRGMPGGSMPSGMKALAKEPPRALREVERLTRNPEKLANAGNRCWKDTLGQKRSFKTHRPPYPTRRGLVTAWQETKKLLHDES